MQMRALCNFNQNRLQQGRDGGVKNSISAVLPNEGRRLIRFAQTPSTCHDLEIRHENGREKREVGGKKGNNSCLSRYFLHFSRRGSNIVSTILDSSTSC